MNSVFYETAPHSFNVTDNATTRLCMCPSRVKRHVASFAKQEAMHEHTLCI